MFVPKTIWPNSMSAGLAKLSRAAVGFFRLRPLGLELPVTKATGSECPAESVGLNLVPGIRLAWDRSPWQTQPPPQPRHPDSREQASDLLQRPVSRLMRYRKQLGE